MVGDRGMSCCFSALDVIKRRHRPECKRETPVVLIVEQHPDVLEKQRPDVLEPTEHDGGITPAQPADEVLGEDLLVEEVSIDGMCGVY
jgi:mycofactocin precursor